MTYSKANTQRLLESSFEHFPPTYLPGEYPPRGQGNNGGLGLGFYF